MNRNASRPLAVTAFFLLLMTILLGDLGRADDVERPRTTIPIVCPADAESPVQIAAEELAIGLNHLFPRDRFRVVQEKPRENTRKLIQLGVPTSLPKFAGQARVAPWCRSAPQAARNAARGLRQPARRVAFWNTKGH